MNAWYKNICRVYLRCVCNAAQQWWVHHYRELRRWSQLGVSEDETFKLPVNSSSLMSFERELLNDVCGRKQRRSCLQTAIKLWKSVKTRGPQHKRPRSFCRFTSRFNVTSSVLGLLGWVLDYPNSATPCLITSQCRQCVCNMCLLNLGFKWLTPIRSLSFCISIKKFGTWSLWTPEGKKGWDVLIRDGRFHILQLRYDALWPQLCGSTRVVVIVLVRSKWQPTIEALVLHPHMSCSVESAATASCSLPVSWTVSVVLVNSRFSRASFT